MFDGTVALVTGASAGIGLAVARQLAGLGARVAMVARGRERLDRAAAALGAERTATFAMDVGDLRDLEALPARVAERLGRLDWVVNNAGIHLRGPVLERTPAELAQMVSVDLAAPIVLTRAAAPLLPRGGAIVNVASLAGMVPVQGAATYSACKAGLRAFTRAAAAELAPRGIRVAAVSPGPVDSEFFTAELDRVAPITFSQPMSSPDQVAGAVLACLRGRAREIAMPWLSGKLATLGYLWPGFFASLRPMLERVGARKKAAYAARRRAGAGPPQEPV